jgi:YhcH/YjgK/YiaL family protein
MAIYGLLTEIGVLKIGNARLRSGLEYLLRFDPAMFRGKKPGFVEKRVIAGENVYAMHQVYTTKPVSQARFEAHRKYIDLQIIWKGRESIAVVPVQGLKVVTPYDAGNDIEFYKFFRSTSLIMQPGIVAVLFPSDAHAPCLTDARSRVVFKTVVKVKI